MGLLLTASVLFILTLVLPAFASATKDEAKAALRLAIAEERAAKAAQQRATHERNALNSALAFADTLKEELSIQNQINLAKEEQDIISAKNALASAKLAEAQEQVKIAAGGSASAMAGLAAAVDQATEDVAEAERKFRKFKERLEESGAATSRLVKDMQGLVGVADDLSNSFTYNLSKAFQNADGTQKGFRQGIDDLANVIRSQITPVGFLAAQISKVTEASIAVAKAQDQAISSFMRATGVSAGYDDVITDTFMSVRHLGVSMQEAGASATALYTEMASFSRESRGVQTALVRTVALMGEVGISASTAAQALDTMTKTLGMSAYEAGNLSERMVQMAVDIGLPPARLMQELSATAPQLAQWGDQTVSVFLDLERAAKATGMAIGELIGITKQYDTFYGAAEAAGRLNAVLGGPYLNSIELLNANEEERIRLLIQSIELSGRSWDALGRFERQAVAAAAGINDMSAASRVFGQSLSEYDNAARAARANAEEQRKLAERAAEAQTVYEMMTAAINSLAVSLRPLVSLLKGFFEILAAITSAISDSPWLSFLAQSALGLKAFVTFGGPFLTLGKPLVKMLFGLGAASNSAALGVRGLGTAFRGLMRVAAAGVIIEAIGALYNFFTKRGSPTFPEYIGIAADNMQRLGAAASSVIAPIRELSRTMPVTADAVVRIGRVDASEAMNIKTKAIPLMAGISTAEIAQMQNASASAGQMIASFNTAQNAISGFISTATGLYPALRGLAESIPQMAMTMESTVTADSSEILRARSAGLSEIRAQNTDVRDGLERLISSNEFYSRRVEAAATSPIQLTLNGRELGRATRGIVNRELRQALG